MHKKYKKNVWKINTNECFLCNDMHRVMRPLADNRTSGRNEKPIVFCDATIILP